MEGNRILELEQTNPMMYNMQFDESSYVKFMKGIIIHKIVTTNGYNGVHNLKFLEETDNVKSVTILYDIVVNGNIIDIDSLDKKDIQFIASYYVSICDIENVTKYYEKLIDDANHLYFIFKFCMERDIINEAKKYALMIIKRGLDIRSEEILKLRSHANSDEYNEFNDALIRNNVKIFIKDGCKNGLSSFKRYTGKMGFPKLVGYSMIMDGGDKLLSSFSVCDSGYEENSSWGFSGMHGSLSEVLDNMIDENVINMISQLSQEEVKTKCNLIQIIYRLIHNQIDMMKLHFDYTLNGKGYDDAERDYYSYAARGKRQNDSHTNEK